MSEILELSEFTKSIINNHNLINKGGFGVVHSYADVKEEYTAIRTKVGLYDASANGLFKVSGDSFLDFVNSLITVDIEFMDVEKSTFTLLLDESGDIIDLLIIYLFDEYIIVETSPDKREHVFRILNEYNVNNEVEIVDISEDFVLLQIEGPLSWKVCGKLIDFEISALPFQSFSEIEYENDKVIMARTGLTGEYGYKFFVSPEKASHLMNFFLNEQEPENEVILVGYKALSIAMLEIRQPNIEFDLNNLSVFEAAAEWLITPYKESFLGKEKLMGEKQQEHKMTVIGFMTEEDTGLKQGDIISLEKPLGKVIQMEYSFGLEKYIGLILLNKEISVSKLAMKVKVKRLNKSIQLYTISSPYILPLSWVNKIT